MMMVVMMIDRFKARRNAAGWRVTQTGHRSIRIKYFAKALCSPSMLDAPEALLSYCGNVASHYSRIVIYNAGDSALVCVDFCAASTTDIGHRPTSRKNRLPWLCRERRHQHESQTKNWLLAAAETIWLSGK